MNEKPDPEYVIGKSLAEQLRERLTELQKANRRLWDSLGIAEPVIGTENVNEVKRALKEGENAE